VRERPVSSIPAVGTSSPAAISSPTPARPSPTPMPTSPVPQAPVSTSSPKPPTPTIVFPANLAKTAPKVSLHFVCCGHILVL
jgi:hypothetical protein